MHQALIVIDHGSRRERSNQQLEQVAAMLRRLRPADQVFAAHMEIAKPDIASAVAQAVDAGARHIVILPYFLSDGRHVSEDIPRLVREALLPHPEVTVQVGRALGPHLALADLLLEQADLRP